MAFKAINTFNYQGRLAALALNLDRQSFYKFFDFFLCTVYGRAYLD